MAGLGFDHPVFKRLWVRIAVVGFTVTWGLFEFSIGETLWGSMFLAVGAVAFYNLFITYKPPPDADSDEKAD